MRKWVVARRISQALFFFLFLYILWSTTHPLKGLLPPSTFFKINPLIVFTTSISERIVLSGFIGAAVMVILTLVFGRFFCGWVCPLGTTIDAANKLFRAPEDRFSPRIHGLMQQVKYLILAFVVVGGLLQRGDIKEDSHAKKVESHI